MGIEITPRCNGFNADQLVQLPEIAAAGFTIHEPPQTPADWMNLEPQTASKKLLGELGVV